MEKTIYCADIIAFYDNKLVVIERLSALPGFALPGGKQDPGETLWETALREMSEETALTLSIRGVLGTYAEKDRDPRGNYVSTVFTGTATGTIRDEPGKTRVHLCTKEEALRLEKQYISGHYNFMEDYLKLVGW